MEKTTYHITRGFILSIVLVFSMLRIASSQELCLSEILYSRDAIEDEEFGYSISISGEYAFVGSRKEDTDSNGQNNIDKAGAVYIYKKTTDGKWDLIQKLVSTNRQKDENFGHSVSVSGNLAAVGAIGKVSPNDKKITKAGVVYLCQLGSDGSWRIINQFYASDLAKDAKLGFSVSIDGERILAGAPGEKRDQNGRNEIDKAGAVYVFERRWWGAWGQVQKIVSPERRKNDNFGESLDILGSQALIGAFKHSDDNYKENGAVYSFTRSLWSGWYFNSKLKTPDSINEAYFGHAIHISGEQAIIGSYGDSRDPNGGSLINKAGSALIYNYSDNGWEYVQKIVPKNRSDDDRFGWSVYLDRDYAVVGAINKDIYNNSGSLISKAGAAYVFENSGANQWNQLSMLALEDPDKDDMLGHAVAFIDKFVLVASTERDKPELENENSAKNSGAVFIFKSCQNIIVNVDTSICQGDSIWLEGAYQKDPGTYTDIYPLPSGNDSIVITELIVLPNSYTSRQVAICDGDSIWLGGAFQRNAGIYIDTYDAVNGCDSIVTTELIITPLSITNVEDSICDGDSIWLGGAFQSLAGMYYDTVPQPSGCPIILVTNLSIIPTPVINIDTTICEGTSIWLEGAYQTEPGTYYDTIPGNSSCDSIKITDLSVTPLSSNTIPISICPGDSIWLIDAYISVPGLYYDTLINPSGCNRIMITDLSFFPTPITQLETRICSGDSIWLGGGYQSIPGTYYDTLTSMHGCDSIVISTLSVSEGQSYTIPRIRSICKGDSIWLQNAYQKTAGIYIDTTIIEPCGDTLLYETTLNAYPLAEIDLGEDKTLCDGETIILDAGVGFESYDWNNGTATNQTLLVNMAGSYNVIATDVNGCTDSDEIFINYQTCTSSPTGNDLFEILIYPNPTSGLLNINMGDKYNGETLQLQISNLRGQVLLTKEVTNTSEFSMEISHLPKGMYYLTINNSKSTFSTKIILK